MHDTIPRFAARLEEFIRRHGSGCLPDNDSAQEAFAGLARELFALQFAGNGPFRALCRSRGVTPEALRDWREIPAVPTAAFKEVEFTSLLPAERTAVFHSSGTTLQRPSRHVHGAASLALYEASLKPWFARHLLADLDGWVDAGRIGAGEKLPLISLTPPPDLAPHSSLAHMFDVVQRDFGSQDSLFAGGVDREGAWTLDLDRVMFALSKSMCAHRPLMLLGTAFSFVHLLDHLAAGNIRYRLAEGSRVLETGGYKGRSRSLPRAELHGLITQHLGIRSDHIVTEYGMSELSSQAYDAVVGSGAERCFRFPPWSRARVVSPEAGREVAEGESGLLCVVDLANAWSVMAVQTEDLAVRRGDGFELLGRAPAVEARGCSLMSLAGA